MAATKTKKKTAKAVKVKAAKKAVRKHKPYTCGNCNRKGHNARTCGE